MTEVAAQPGGGEEIDTISDFRAVALDFLQAVYDDAADGADIGEVFGDLDTAELISEVEDVLVMASEEPHTEPGVTYLHEELGIVGEGAQPKSTAEIAQDHQTSPREVQKHILATLAMLREKVASLVEPSQASELPDSTDVHESGTVVSSADWLPAYGDIATAQGVLTARREVRININGGIRLLTKAEEGDLGQIIQRGIRAAEILESNTQLQPSQRRALEIAVRQGRAAYDYFFEANTGLAKSMARPQTENGTYRSYDVAFQNAALGLMRAILDFDHRKGFKFSTYARWWIRQSLQEGLVTGDSQTIRIPSGARRFSSQYDQARSKLEQELDQTPTIVQIAERMGLSVERLRENLRDLKYTEVLSLDIQLGAEDSDETLGDLVASDADDPAETAASRVLVEELLELLNPIQLEVVRLKNGLNGPTHSYQQIAEELGTSKDKVRHIYIRALGIMRTSQSGNELGDI